MAIAIQWLVRNLELRTIIARIVQIAGKASVLEILADIKDKKHPLINAVVSEVVSSICTENNQIITASLQQMLIYGKEATTQIENSVPYYSVSKWSSNTKMLLLHFHAP